MIYDYEYDQLLYSNARVPTACVKDSSHNNIQGNRVTERSIELIPLSSCWNRYTNFNSGRYFLAQREQTAE